MTEKIKVMRVIARLNIGGPAIQAILLTAHLDQKAFESLLVSGVEAEYEGNMLELAAEKNVELVILPQLGREINPVRDLMTILKLYRLIKKERPLIVHTHTAKAGTVGRLAARLAGVPVIVHTFHGHVFHSYFSPAKTRLFIRIERFLARFSNRVITVSQRLKEEIADYGIAKPAKIEVVPLGFELKPFLEASDGKFRRELGLSDEVKLVGIVGRLTKVKNHEFFLRVASKVAANFPAARFIIVGDGELRQELEEFTAELGLSDKVVFTGWRKNMPQVYASLNVVALTSLNEGTPVTLIEAMAAGCPVVATNVGGVPDLVVHDENGYLADSLEIDEFAGYVLTLLNDPFKGQTMGKKGRQRVKETFTLERLLEDISGLYLRLLKEKGILINFR